MKIQPPLQVRRLKAFVPKSSILSPSLQDFMSGCQVGDADFSRPQEPPIECHVTKCKGDSTCPLSAHTVEVWTVARRHMRSRRHSEATRPTLVGSAITMFVEFESAERLPQKSASSRSNCFDRWYQKSQSLYQPTHEAESEGRMGWEGGEGRAFSIS